MVQSTERGIPIDLVDSQLQSDWRTGLPKIRFRQLKIIIIIIVEKKKKLNTKCLYTISYRRLDYSIIYIIDAIVAFTRAEYIFIVNNESIHCCEQSFRHHTTGKLTVFRRFFFF